LDGCRHLFSSLCLLAFVFWHLLSDLWHLFSGLCVLKMGGFMNISKMMDEIKQHPDFNKVGMVLCHNGVVRGISREGRGVKGLSVSVDHRILDQIVSEQKKRPGIVDIQVEIAEDRDLKIGNDVMLLLVAGDIRENVIAVLTDTLNQIKTTVTKKTEYFSS
jgi:molybdopterin synthase catalytic subunit